MNDWEARWRQTWRELGLTPGQGVLPDLLARYGEPQRRYHTLQHLADCFERFDTLRDGAVRPGEVLLALWFHDAVYDVHRNDNEEKARSSHRLACKRPGRQTRSQDVCKT